MVMPCHVGIDVYTGSNCGICDDACGGDDLLTILAIMMMTRWERNVITTSDRNDVQTNDILIDEKTTTLKQMKKSNSIMQVT